MIVCKLVLSLWGNDFPHTEPIVGGLKNFKITTNAEYRLVTITCISNLHECTLLSVAHALSGCKQILHFMDSTLRHAMLFEKTVGNVPTIPIYYIYRMNRNYFVQSS